MKTYTPKSLVHGFCIPSGESGEKLVCLGCGIDTTISRWNQRITAVTFDGRVNCAICKEVLK
jgi:hypothetical protein